MVYSYYSEGLALHKCTQKHMLIKYEGHVCQTAPLGFVRLAYDIHIELMLVCSLNVDL